MTLLRDIWTLIELMLIPGALRAALDQAFPFNARKIVEV